MARNVLVLLRASPLNTDKVAEGLRMSAGLTIRDHRVTVALLDGAALAGTRLEPERVGGPELAKHLEMLDLLEMPVWAEAESLHRFGASEADLVPSVRAVGRAEIEAAMLRADAVIPF